MLNLRRLALTVLVLVICCVEKSRAETIAYSLTFCENLDVLKDPTNQLLIKNVSATNQHSLMMQRTSPYIELRNISDQAMISQISMSIGDVSKNFDWGKMVEASPGVNFNILSIDEVMGGISSDELTISFTGLAPGDFVRFRVGIASDNPNAGYIQDYREVLFDLDGSDTSDNSVVAVDFDSSGGVERLITQLPNFSMNGLTTATSILFPGGPDFDHVVPFNLTVSVPEPATYILATIGAIAVLAVKRRNKLTSRAS